MTEYTFTAFTEQDLLNAGAEGHSVNCGDTFTMPAEATTCFTVHDDDACLSGDRYDHATDHSGQTATIEGADGSHLGNGGQIYAEKYFWVHDNAGNWYVMLEIEQEGSDDDYFAFYTGGHYTVPPAGAELTVHSECDVSGEWLRYDDIDAGDKGPDNGWIKGRLTFDADCNDNEWNDETHTWDEGVAHKTVQLVDLDGNVVAEATTDAHGNYMFDVAPGEYKVKFPLPDGFKFSAKDSGVDEHFDSDANPDGLTDTIHVSSGQTIHDVDAGLKPVGPEFILDDDCAYTIEAEDMMLTNYKVEHVATASGGEVASLAGTGQHAGFAKVDFGGTAGKYDIELTVYDENDGQGFFDVFINGEFVQCFELDLDAGDNFTGVSSIRTLKIEGIELNVGDEVIVKGRENCGEFARFDKIKFIQEKEAPGTIKGSVWCDVDCDGLQDGDVTITKGENLIVNGDFEDNCLSDSGATWGGLKSGWYDIGHQKVNVLEQDYGHGNATGDAVAELECGVILCQEVHVAESGVYCLTFDVSRRGHSDQDNTFELFVNGHRLTTVIAQGQETLTFDLDLHEGVNRFDFKSLSHTYIGAAIDDVELRQVIETTTPSEPFKEGVVIKLLNADGTPVLDDNGVEITTVTDANGNYQFDDVPVGDYRIMGVAPDGTEFTLQDVGSDDTIDSDVDANGLSGVIHVSEEAVIDVDLGLKDEKPEFRVCDDPDAVNIDFEGFAAGTVIDDEYAGVGVTISAQRDDNNTPENDAMVFDSNNPTGGDTDLATTTQNNILIVSEDNDSSDPDDAIGGTITFDFDNPSFIYDVKILDTEEGGTIDLFDADGNSLGSIDIPSIGDGEIQQVLVDTDGVSQMVITLNGSGAIDDLCFVPGEPEALGSLSGRYFCDENRDDTENDGQGGFDVGVADAVVRLFLDGQFVAETTTSANGDYRFDDLVPADGYQVRFQDPNDVAGQAGKSFVAANVGAEGEDSDVTIVGSAGNGLTDPTISVVSGQETQNVDAGIVAPLPQPGSISGRYFCDENRDDTENDGQGGFDVGVADAVVRLFLDGQFVAETTTNANGDYRFDDLVPADGYQVEFQDPNDVAGQAGKSFVAANVGAEGEDSDVTIVGSAGNGLTDPTISVVSGQETQNVDAGIVEPAPLPGSLSGRYFLDTDGDNQDNGNGNEPGIAGVVVELVDANGPTGITETTGSNGTYSFSGLAAGTYSVIFTDPNGVLAGTELVTPNQGPEESDSDAIGDTTLSQIVGIEVLAGLDTPDNDAGVRAPTFNLNGNIETLAVQTVTYIVDHSVSTTRLTPSIVTEDLNGDGELTRYDFILQEIIDSAATLEDSREINIILAGRDVTDTNLQIAPIQGELSTTAGEIKTAIAAGAQAVVDLLNPAAPPASLIGNPSEVSELDLSFAFERAEQLITQDGTRAAGGVTDDVIVVTTTGSVGDFDFTGGTPVGVPFREAEFNAAKAALSATGAEIDVLLIDPNANGPFAVPTDVLDSVDKDGVADVLATPAQLNGQPFNLERLLDETTETATVVDLTVDGESVAITDEDPLADGFQFSLTDISQDPSAGIFLNVDTGSELKSIDLLPLLTEDPADTFNFNVDLNDFV